MEFFGRKEELQSLRGWFETAARRATSQMLAVTGRHGAGKTRLLEEAFAAESVPVFHFHCREAVSEAETARKWLEAVCRAYNRPMPALNGRVVEVLRFAAHCTHEKPCVVVIDECEKLDRLVVNLWGQLQAFWDLNKDGTRLLLVFSSADATLMRRAFYGLEEPLYGRISTRIDVAPFFPEEMTDIVHRENPQAGKRDLLAVYAVTGAAAGLLSFLAAKKALSEKGILQLLALPEGEWLRNEGRRILAEDLPGKDQAFEKVIRAVAYGRHTRADFRAVAGENAETVLEALLAADIVQRAAHGFGDWPMPEDERFILKDRFTEFWLRFAHAAVSGKLLGSEAWEAYLEEKLVKWLARKAVLDDVCRSYACRTEGAELFGADLALGDSYNKKAMFAAVSLDPRPCDTAKLTRAAAAFCRKYPETAGWEKHFGSLSLADA